MKLKKKKKEETPSDNSYKIAVGLDIGTTKVVAFVGEREENNRIKILGYGECPSYGVTRGQVVNVTETTKAIQEAINMASNHSDTEIDTVVVGIAGQHIKHTQTLGEIKRKNSDTVISNDDVKMLSDDMFKIMVNPGTEIIEVIPQEYTVDNYNDLLDPRGVVGTQLSSVFNVVTGDTQHIKNIIRCIKACHLTMEDLVLEPIASAEAVLDEKEKEVGVALIDIGGGTTDIAIFYNGILRHTAVIPIGGEVITDDIKRTFTGISAKDAEALKINHGYCLHNPADENQIISIPGIKGRPAIEIPVVDLSKCITARVEDIFNRIREELIKSNYHRHLGCGLVLTGGGAELRHIKEYAEYLTGMTIRIGFPEEKILPESESKNKNNTWFHPKYATGIGLLIRGIENEDNLTFTSGDPSSNTEDGQQTPLYRPWDLLRKRLGDIINTITDENIE